MVRATDDDRDAARSAADARREGAFSIIEIIIAALLLAVVVAAATAVFAGSTRTTSENRVADRQTALANQVLAKLQADPSWAAWCRAQPNPNDCDLAQWLSDSSRRYDQLGTIADAGGGMRFTIAARAVGSDLELDGLGADDQDGVRPDVYQLSVTVTPDRDTVRRHPNVRPMVLQAELNPSIRLTSGRVTVDACRATNQVDERLPIGDCTGGPTTANLLPPAALDTRSNGQIASTCDGPINVRRGADERDCDAFKCADRDIAAMGSVRAKCEASFPGWEPPSTWPGMFSFFTKVAMQPVSGNVRLYSERTNRWFGPVPLNGGRAEFRDLPIGEYRVVAAVGSGDRLWRSKSVPSTQRVAVEAGLNSRAVLIYRPAATGSVTIPVRSLDASIPWSPRELPGWTFIDKSGNILPPSQPVKLCLVPVPQGRLAAEDVPCQEFPQGPATTEFRFTGVEPGLYSVQLADGAYNNFMTMSGTGGFLWISEGGGVVHSLAPGQTLEYVNGLCAEYVRDTVVGTTWDPVNDRPIPPVQDCSAPSGGAGAGGSGGTGVQ